MSGVEFSARHCGVSARDEQTMLQTLGLQKLEDLARALPADIAPAPLGNFEPPLSERDALDALRALAMQNDCAKKSMLGLGYYDVETPAALRRNLFENPAWYTAYTPYQAEISQGRLELLFHFQTMCAELTGLPMANASLLDEATAAAEAMAMMRRCSDNDGNVFLVDESLFPQTLAVLQTRAAPMGIELRLMPAREMSQNHKDAFGAFIGYPGGDGNIKDWRETIATLKQNNIAAACATDLLALTLLTPPGEMGFDIAVGNSQRFGVPMGCGGPHAAFFAFAAEYTRHAPGRVVGQSRDTKERAGYRLALQTREQHIRREKATSNICTAQALPAMLAAAYAIYHGAEHLKESARRVHCYAASLAECLRAAGREVKCEEFFDTLRVVADDAEEVVKRAEENGVNLLRLQGEVGISVDDSTELSHLQIALNAFGGGKIAVGENACAIADSLKRQSAFCDGEVFNACRSEQEITRYLRRLADKDISLNRSMIPLGSCTMKLNAAAEMEPLAWREFANIHPFAPATQTRGYRKLLADLSQRLADLTGFDSVSLQPNAGAQGEYAGLLAIRAYLQSRGETSRDVCLIPLSAHGTNPASAAMAGMRVVTVNIDDSGQADAEDLARKIEQHGDSLAALMMTYPSTSGVFAEGMPDICKRVHDAGGQVYMDGANLNALVGAALPGKMGPDVMHINLHKTFCIPHGGGGPGMGPIAVAEHLSPFMPSHPLAQDDTEGASPGCGTVSAAPFGSALILVIPWLYMRMMGGEGLRKATLTALLSANYVARRLEKAWPVQFRGRDGFVAHECIVDARPFKKSAGVSVEDVAKRLMDYGFHAPTVSWPLPGAVMIEPTESESLPEIDRFCDAMLQIAEEIARIAKGELPQDDNPLVNAPHTAEDLLADDWRHPYTREEAAYPSAWIRDAKYWPPVSRIDAVYGDRALLKK